MVTDNHYITLYINKELVELESQESLGLRINNVVFNPTKTSTTQAEYSFSFNIPSTPINDKILTYANCLAKENKFHARYAAQVYADEEMIFDGSLTVTKFDTNKKEYECNLVNIKINSLDEIFGDTKLTDLSWEVPFDGAVTINSINNNEDSKYYFPLVSYGVFQKKYESKDEAGETYTSKFVIDKYNRFWIESFYPSLNMMETIKQAFTQKGYTIGGSAFSDQNITNIFASTNLATEQSPLYNLGNPSFGHLDITTTVSTQNLGNGYQQELSFPYYQVSSIEADNTGINQTTNYNLAAVNLYNAFTGNTSINGKSYMYDPNELVIVAPADGFYKIEMTVNTTLNTTGNISAALWTTDDCIQNMEERTVGNMPAGFFNNITPVEVQLVRNYDDNLELIKGKWNTVFYNGDPTKTTRVCTTTKSNTDTWETCFPHEYPYQAKIPTETNDLVITRSGTGNRMGGRRQSGGNTVSQDGNGNYSSGNDETSQSGNFSGRRGGTRGTSSSGGDRINTERKWSNENYGYVYDDANESSTAGHVRHTNIMCYDQAVSHAFICGVSTMSSGVTAVMKNGYSWTPSDSSKNESFYPEIGYNNVHRTTAGTIVEEDGNGFNKNEYINAPISYTDMTNTGLTGYVSCMVWLNKNDIIEPLVVHREYHDIVGNPINYNTTTTVNIKMTAFTDKNYERVKSEGKNRYDAPVEFPVNLNLFNFTNKETKVSDWIDSVLKGFNLEMTQDGNSVSIDINRGIKKSITYAVELDNRVSDNEAVAEFISYPREMSVQYKTDIEEYGFEYSVTSRYPEHIDDPDWYKWGDSGYTVIKLSDDSYETTTQNTQTNFSYNWYCPFTWKQVNYDPTSGYVETGVNKNIMLPVIEKSEYMADGYGYAEAMKHDGYSFTQRFWFRQPVSSDYVILSDNNHETVYLSYPVNSYDGFHLSYKDTEKSIVSEYFNVAPMLSSNYVNLDAYLSPDEYKALKGGAMAHFNSDLYYVSEINGYDPSSINPTSLKLIKKP